MKPKAPKPLVCWYGTDWLAYFKPPIGTGKGCQGCETGAQQERFPVEYDDSTSATSDRHVELDERVLAHAACSAGDDDDPR